MQRFQGMLKLNAMLGVQQDVSSLSGQSGKHSAAALSPEKAVGGNAGSSSTTAAAGGVQQVCGVKQAAAALFLFMVVCRMVDEEYKHEPAFVFKCLVEQSQTAVVTLFQQARFHVFQAQQTPQPLLQQIHIFDQRQAARASSC